MTVKNDKNNNLHNKQLKPNKHHRRYNHVYKKQMYNTEARTIRNVTLAEHEL